MDLRRAENEFVIDADVVHHRLGAAGLGLTACGAGSTTGTAAATSSPGSGSNLTEVPDETNGPYPADGTNGPDILERSGVIRKTQKQAPFRLPVAPVRTVHSGIKEDGVVNGTSKRAHSFEIG